MQIRFQNQMKYIYLLSSKYRSVINLRFIQWNNKNPLDKISIIYFMYRIFKCIKYVLQLQQNDMKSFMLKYFKNVSFIKNKITQEKLQMRKKIKDELNLPILQNNLTVYTQLPKQGLHTSKIIHLLNKYKEIEMFHWNQGKVSGTVYNNMQSLKNLMNTIFPIFYQSNPLHPDVFPGVRKMEAEIVQMSGKLLHSKQPNAGSFTSGGTESIILACKAYRSLAKIRNITYPEIIVCNSGHAAYWKAGNYLNIKIVEVEYQKNLENQDYGKVLLQAIMQKKNSNTIAIIASAPSFHFGIIDPISQLSDYCIQQQLYLHIDMCLGGFILPFLKKYRHISFQTPGISSISLDTHKYGYGPKGGSVILYKNTELFKHQMFVKDDWSGGIYGTTNISGSRNGNCVALTWATMVYLGYQGYQEKAQQIVSLTKYLYQEINNIPELYVFGKPEVCIVAVGSHEFDIYLLCDQLKILGWNLNILQNPPAFHFCITNCHTTEIINSFITDIKKSLIHVKNKIEKEGTQITSNSLYGSTQKIGDSDIITDVVKDYFCLINEVI